MADRKLLLGRGMAVKELSDILLLAKVPPRKAILNICCSQKINWHSSRLFLFLCKKEKK